MIISIIGSGALGKLYGGLLSLSNHDVHFLCRSEYELLNKQKYFNLQINQLSKNLKITTENIHHNANTLPPSDVVIISIKTTENNKLPALLQTVLKPNTIVLVIQNGIGNEETLSKICQTQPIIRCISTAAATRQPNGNVEIFSIGDLRIAPFKAQHAAYCETIQSIFDNTTEIPIKIFENYKEICWHKLLWNVPFCSLSIIYHQSSDILASEYPYHVISTSIMQEIVQIAKAENTLITKDYFDNLINLTKKLKNYYPSMYWDYKYERPVEKEYIIDNVVEIAKGHQLAIPTILLAQKCLEKI